MILFDMIEGRKVAIPLYHIVIYIYILYTYCISFTLLVSFSRSGIWTQTSGYYCQRCFHKFQVLKSKPSEMSARPVASSLAVRKSFAGNSNLFFQNSELEMERSDRW